MKNLVLLVLVLPVLAACACAAPRESGPVIHSAPASAPTGLIESPSVAPSAHDIGEARRREWFDANRPAPETTYRPEQIEPAEAESEPAPYGCHDPCYDPWGGWLLPFSLSLGYWGGGHHHGGGGWGVGLGFGGHGGW